MTAVGASPRPARARHRESGFSLIEVMISSALFLVLLAGASTMLMSVQEGYEDSQLVMDAQQGARIAMEQIQRDLHVVGVGLSRMQPPFAVFVPRADGGIDLRRNRGQVTSFLTKPMGSGSAVIELDDVSEFSVGQDVAVYDATGSIDIAAITHINIVSSRIVHTGVSKGYDPADGAAVAVVETITYRTEVDGATFNLIREVDGADPAIRATGVSQLVFRYFDDANPPLEITPTTLADQMSVRLFEVSLTVRAQGTRLRGGAVPEVSLSARIAPRSLVLF